MKLECIAKRNSENKITLCDMCASPFKFSQYDISLFKSTAERSPFPTPSITAYYVLFFARLFLQIFQSRPSILYQAFSTSFIVIQMPVSLFVHLLSFTQATCPTHLHCCLITCVMSFTLVFSLI